MGEGVWVGGWMIVVYKCGRWANSFKAKAPIPLTPLPA